MKTEIKVAIITGLLAIIGAVFPVIPGWYGPNAPVIPNEERDLLRVKDKFLSAFGMTQVWEFLWKKNVPSIHKLSVTLLS